jgi:hypothetical protein
MVDQYLLASMDAGCCDSTLATDRSVLFEFIRHLGRPLWTARAADADRSLAYQRRELSRSHSTVHKKALALGSFFDFRVARYQGDVQVLTGHVVEQVIDEFNRPATSRSRSPGRPRTAGSPSGWIGCHAGVTPGCAGHPDAKPRQLRYVTWVIVRVAV